MNKSRAENPKRELFQQLAVMARAFGSGARLELIDYLAQGERTVEDLSRVAGFSIANTSKHLQQLKAAGLVRARRQGKHVWYGITDDRVVDAVGSLQELAHDHLERVKALVASYLERRDGLEPVQANELLDRARDGLVTVIDVRPPEEYAQGHIAGALNIPLDDLSRELEKLPRDREVVAYCRGPWCVLSYEAVARLRRAGLTARRLQSGLPEWRYSGLPVEVD
jgi:rhodanese-related sulfurtransferase